MKEKTRTIIVFASIMFIPTLFALIAHAITESAVLFYIIFAVGIGVLYAIVEWGDRNYYND